MDGFDPVTDEAPSRLAQEDEELEAEGRWAAGADPVTVPPRFVAGRALAPGEGAPGAAPTLVVATSRQGYRLLHAACPPARREPLGALAVPGAPVRGVTAGPGGESSTCAAFRVAPDLSVALVPPEVPAEAAAGATAALLGALSPGRVVVASQEAAPGGALAGGEEGATYSVRTPAWAAPVPASCPPLPPGVPLSGVAAAAAAWCRARGVPALVLTQPVSRPVPDSVAARALARALADAVGDAGGLREAVEGAASRIASREDRRGLGHASATVYM